MTVIRLSVIVSNLDETRENFDSIKIYRSTTGIDGTYAELTAPQTRPALEANKTVYDYTDQQGDEDYYYRSSYFNSTGLTESSLSDPQKGVAATALEILTVEELKLYYLFGLDLTDDYGNELPDAFFEHYIQSSVAWMSEQLDIPLTPTRFDELHDFIREDFDKYIWLELDKFPVIEVESVTLELPTNQVVKEFDSSWFHVQKDSGQLQLMPGQGSAGTVMLGAAGSWLPLVLNRARTIPDAFRVIYSAGFETGKVPYNIKDLIGKRAALGPLNILGDLIVGAGIASYNLSIDGLSEGVNTTSSATNAGYGARIIQYTKEIKEDLPDLIRYYKGMRLRVV